MKTRELIKLNDRHSIVEAIYEQKETEYVVCSNYDQTKEPGSQWSSGAYCCSLENAIKYAAKHCFKAEYIYVVMEFEDSILGLISTGLALAISVFTAKYVANIINKLFNFEGFIVKQIKEDFYGNIECRLSFDGDYSIDMKLIEIRI